MSKPLDILIDTYTLSLRNRNLSELTISSYTSTLSRFISFLEDKKYATSIGDITKDHIEMYLAQLKHPATTKKNGVIVKNEKANEPLEATTRATVIAALRSFFKWAHAHSYITTNPAALIINPRTARKNVKTVSEKNVKKLFNKAEQSKFPSRDRFIFTLMLSTGPRVQEVAKLNVGHVNVEERKIFISGKGNKERELYISDALMEDLTEYLSDREKILKEHGKLDEQSLLISQKGARPLSKRGLQHIITTLAKQANVTTESGNQVSAHKLRHTFATTLYNKNPKVDVLILGSLLGHSDPNSTKIYTQISKEVMRDVLETDLYNMDNK